MVQCVLSACRAHKVGRFAAAVLGILLLTFPAHGARKQKGSAEQPWPELLLEGGRKLTYERTLSSNRDIRPAKQGFWSKFADIVVGEPDVSKMYRPYDIAVDSRGRMIVTDPQLAAVHIFDVAGHKYKLIDRWDKSSDPMIEPQCVAVDAEDNIYVTDSKAGKVFVFDGAGKTRRVFGSIKGGEGFFKRPTGIAVDTNNRRVYVTDTLRDSVFILDMDGRVIRSFGTHGSGSGEFSLPTQVYVKGSTVAVVDAMNFRIQIFDLEGNVRGMIGKTGDPNGGVFRPKGIAIDSEDHIYLADGQFGVVQVFDREGRLLYNFGNGTGFGEFRLPAGLYIDKNDRVYLVDSLNSRVQIFQYHAKRTTLGNSSE